MAPARLSLALPARSDVGVELLDLSGRRVANRADETLGPGRFTITWSLPPLAPGVYFVHVNTNAGNHGLVRWVVVR